MMHGRKNIKFWKDWLTDGMSYVVPTTLHISKHIWLMFYSLFKLFFLFYIWIFY